MVVDGRTDFRVAEIYQIGAPLRVAVFCKEGCVGGHLHHVGVALHGGEIESFGQGSLNVAGTTVEMGGPFPEIYVRLATVVRIVIVLVVNHPSGLHVVVFVDHWNALLCGELPAELVIGAFVEWADGAYHFYFRVRSGHGVVDFVEALGKHRSNHILIADAYVFEVERLGMAGLGAESTPSGGAGVAVGVFYQVEHILNVGVHLLHRNAALLAVGGGEGVAVVRRVARVLAGDASGHHRERLGTDVLAEKEIFMVAQAAGLVISPEVTKRLARLKRTDGALPVVDVVDTVAVGHAAAGKAHEARMEVGERLRQVGAEAVAAPLEGVAREERNHVEMQLVGCRRDEHKPAAGGGFRRRKRGLVLLPSFSLGRERSGGENVAERVAQFDAEPQGLGAGAEARAQRKVVFLTLLQGDTVEAAIAECLPLEHGIVRIVGVDGIVGGDLRTSGGIVGMPGGSGRPLAAVVGVIFEVAVLDKLGV